MQKAFWKITFAIYFFGLATNLNAIPVRKPLSGSTQFVHQSYNWIQKRTIMKLSEVESQETAIILKDKRLIEYAYDLKTGRLFMYDTRHKIIRVNSHSAIEEFNKVYIPMRNALSIIEIKARFISKTGRIVELDKNQIKDLDNPYNAGLFKIFAISGAEVGGEIEYIYTLKQQPRFFGREIFQTSVTAKDVSFEIVTPKNLVFEAKSYNNFPQMEMDIDRYADKNVLGVYVNKVESLAPEQYSYYHANLMRVDYKWGYDKEETEKAHLMTWDYLGEFFHSDIYSFSKKMTLADRQKMEKFLKKIIPASATTAEEKIKAIEKYIKQNIRLAENSHNKEENPLDVLRNRHGSEIGIVRLFAALFTLADVEHEVVLTTDRTYAKFDRDFETLNYLDKYLFHFPNTQHFLAPHSPEYKYGTVPYHYTHNQGLFISPSYEGFDIFSSKIQEIPASEYQSNYDVTELNVKFASDFSTTNIHLKRSFSGYYAVNLLYHYENSSEAQKKEVIENVLRRFGNDIKVANVEVNHQQDDPYTDYFKIEADLTTSSPIEYAGNNFLFRIGDLMDKHEKISKEQERHLHIERDYQQGVHKIIYLEIPEGYWIKNITSLNQEAFIEENGERTAAFTSRYDVVGNNLIRIEIEEFYKKIDYSKDRIQDFHKIADAVSSFNKIALVFEKEN
jgi:predicted DNA binding protein